MFRSSAKPFFGVFFILVGTVIISSAACDIDVEEAPQDLEYTEETVEEIEFSEKDLVTAEKFARVDRMFGFIGDLRLGKRRANETLHIKVLKVCNKSNAVLTTYHKYAVPKGKVHYMAVLNLGIGNAAICSVRNFRPAPKVLFGTRVHARRTAMLTLLVAFR